MDIFKQSNPAKISLKHSVSKKNFFYFVSIFSYLKTKRCFYQEKEKKIKSDNLEIRYETYIWVRFGVAVESNAC